MSSQNDVEDLAETVGTFAKVFAKRIVRQLSTAIEDVDQWSRTEPEKPASKSPQTNDVEYVDPVRMVASLMRKSFSPQLLAQARGCGLIIKITPNLRDELLALAAQGDTVSTFILDNVPCTEN